MIVLLAAVCGLGLAVAWITLNAVYGVVSGAVAATLDIRRYRRELRRRTHEA